MGDITPSDVHQPGPLSRLLNRRRLRRGVVEILEAVAKAAGQPRWPAGAPNSQGGQFAPKETIGANELGNHVGGQQGTNPGGTYSGPNGLYYVKQYTDHSRAAGEHLSNAVYRSLNIGAPESFLVASGGTTKSGMHASKIIEGETVAALGDLSKDRAVQFADGFAADVLLANWDAVGTGKDNILVGHNGKVYRIDNGGTLLMRAQQASGRKPEHLLDQITEVDGFLDPVKNPHYADVLKKAGVKQGDQNDPSSYLYQAVQEQVKTITALRDAHGGWDKFVATVSPSWSGKDRDRVVQMLEARTKLLAERFGVAASGKDIAAAVKAASHNSVEGIQLPPPSTGSSYAAKGYNKALAETGAILNGPGTIEQKLAALEKVKGPTAAHFFGKKFAALKGDLANQLNAAKASAKAKATPAPAPPQIPLPANSGIHKAKWQQKAIDALHAASKEADPYTAISQIALGPSHSGTVKKYKQELLGWAADQLPGTIGKDGSVTIAPAPKKMALGITPAATQLAQTIQAKTDKAKAEWDTMFPAPPAPASHSKDIYEPGELGKPSVQTLMRIRVERAARVSPESVDHLMKSYGFSYQKNSEFTTWAQKMRDWAAERQKVTGPITGKVGDNISGFEILSPSSTGGQPEKVPQKMASRTHEQMSQWGYNARLAIRKTNPAHEDAVTDYQGAAYAEMNQYLLHTPSSYNPQTSKYKGVVNLQAALLHPSARLPQDTKVIRNFGSGSLGNFFAGNAPLLQGSTVSARTFLSSSLTGNFASGAGVKLVIHAKKGTPGLYLNSGKHSTGAYEREVLFPSGTKLRIHVVKKENSTTVIEASVVD